MATKRPHKTLTLAEKYSILKQLENGVTGRQLAQKYGIGTSTISDIKKNSEKIKRYVDNTPSDELSRKKSLKEGEFPEMENELCVWFKTQNDKQVVTSSSSISEKAKELYVKHYGNDKFKASQGWLTNFKKRHNIRFCVCRKKPIDEHPVSQTELFLDKLRAKVKELQLIPSQIYVLEVSALFWKVLPFGPESNNKERIKFLACTNIDGTHKLKLTVIGKDKYWKSLRNTLIPIDYYSEQNGDTLLALLQTWFHKSFVEQTRDFLANNKAMLVVTNSFGHELELETIMSDNDGKIITMFLPENFTETSQTIEQQNVISLIKLLYRKNLLVNILSFDDNDVSEILNKISFRDCIFHFAIAWNQVPSDFIKSYYNGTIFREPENEVPFLPMTREHDSEYLALLTAFKDKLSNPSSNDEDTDELMKMLKYIETELEFNEQLMIIDGADDDESEIIIKDEEKDESTVTNEEAINSFDICIQWAEQHGAQIDELITLRCLKLKSMYEKQKALTQTFKSDEF